MPFCTECGKRYQDEVRFCPHCGNPNALKKNEKQEVENFNEYKQSTELGQSGDYGSPEDAGIRRKTNVSQAGSYGLDERNLPELTSLEKGRYTILKKLGAGGFGVVYKASDANYDGETKALKVIYSENYSDKLVMHKLKTEAKNMIKINHPRVVRLYDLHFENEIKFMDIEFVDGGDLLDLMLRSPDYKIPEERVWELANQIAQGMQAVHKVNLIHQDLKPENILLTKSGDVKITDFGISESFRSSKSRIKETDVKGTYVYASPEQLVGKKVGKEADIWSFGVTLYHILTGETLYSGNQSSDVLLQIENREFEPIAEVSVKMNALLAKCLMRDYKERFRDFGEVLEFIDMQETPKVQSKSLARRKSVKGFVFVEGGTFKMCSLDGFGYEKLVHNVTLSDFYIGKYPVKQAEWEEVMGKNPSKFKGNKNNPVECVSWYDAVEFCNKKSIKDGLDPCYSINKSKQDVNNKAWPDDLKWTLVCDFSKNGYRLPTEAEWEYAARGGNISKGYTYSGSNNVEEVAEYEGNNDKSTKPVGGRIANELGIYDMSGNVWEWCWDWHGDYSSSSQTDPPGLNSGSERVIRGGSWNYSASYCRVAGRSDENPFWGRHNIGFRLARSSI